MIVEKSFKTDQDLLKFQYNQAQKGVFFCIRRQNTLIYNRH